LPCNRTDPAHQCFRAPVRGVLRYRTGDGTERSREIGRDGSCTGRVAISTRTPAGGVPDRAGVNARYKETFRECLNIVRTLNPDAICEIHYRFHKDKPMNDDLEREATHLFPGVVRTV
jgi:hypothetical protein